MKHQCSSLIVSVNAALQAKYAEIDTALQHAYTFTPTL